MVPVIEALTKFFQIFADGAGRKLTGLVVCVAGMVITAVVTLSLCSAEWLDGSVAQNLTLTVVGGIGTLYATLVGGNLGEHRAKTKLGIAQAENKEQALQPPSLKSPVPSVQVRKNV